MILLQINDIPQKIKSLEIIHSELSKRDRYDSGYISYGSDFEFVRDDSSNEPLPIRKGNLSIMHQPSVAI